MLRFVRRLRELLELIGTLNGLLVDVGNAYGRSVLPQKVQSLKIVLGKESADSPNGI